MCPKDKTGKSGSEDAEKWKKSDPAGRRARWKNKQGGKTCLGKTRRCKDFVGAIRQEKQSSKQLAQGRRSSSWQSKRRGRGCEEVHRKSISLYGKLAEG